MNAFFTQISNIFRATPLSRKLLAAAVLAALVAGFVLLYLQGQKAVYEPLFSNLAAEDASAIADKLRERKVPFQIQGGGSLILVPADQVYDLRLALAGEGIPKGGGVGFEVFDKTDFGTTEFVQKLNYQRALQGELARTIKEFGEVADARVMIVMPRESVFIEAAKPASASVLLKLRGRLPADKVDAVVNLVASSVEDLAPENVTVVDTAGNVLSKKRGDGGGGDVADAKLNYKLTYEATLARQIQSMLEQIVGPGKAIVRVSAEMNFDQVDLSEETFDPETPVVRSRQQNQENSEDTQGSTSGISSVNPLVAAGQTGVTGQPGAAQKAQKSQKNGETVNYEISRTVRKTVNPVARIERVSVAAVLDGNYTTEPGKDGKEVKTYVPRTPQEINQFVRIVQNAMGYSADREDQVTVESFPFSSMEEAEDLQGPAIDWMVLMRRYGHLAGYAALIFAAFFFLVKPMLGTVREVSARAGQGALTVRSQGMLPGMEGLEALPPPEMSGRQKATYLARQNVEKTTEQIRGWLGESS